MSSTVNLDLVFQAVDQVSQQVKRINGSLDSMKGQMEKCQKQTRQMEKQTSFLKQTLATTAGMLIRDMVQGLAKTFSEVRELGAEMQTLRASFAALTAASEDEVSTLEELREATRGTVADVDLLTSANQALMLGLPTKNLDELFASAIKLGHAMGIDAKYAVESLTKGIGRQSKLILDNLGIVFDATEAYEWYASQLGTTVEQLDEATKKEAWMQYAIEQVTEAAENLGDVTSEAQMAQEKWSASIKNAKTRLGELMAPLGRFLPMIEGSIPIMTTIAMTVVPQLIAAFSSMVTSYGFLGAATMVWATITKIASAIVSASIYSIPIIGWIAAAITAMITLYIAFRDNWLGITDATVSAGRKIGDALGAIGDKIGALGDEIGYAYDVATKGVELTSLEHAQTQIDIVDKQMKDQLAIIQEGMNDRLEVIERALNREIALIDSQGNRAKETLKGTYDDEVEATIDKWMKIIDQNLEGFDALIQEYRKHYQQQITTVQRALTQELREHERTYREITQEVEQAYQDQIQATNAGFDAILGTITGRLEDVRKARQRILNEMELAHLQYLATEKGRFEEGAITEEEYMDAVESAEAKYRKERQEISDEYRIQELIAEIEFADNEENIEAERIAALEALERQHLGTMQHLAAEEARIAEEITQAKNDEILKLERERTDILVEIREEERAIEEKYNDAITRLERVWESERTKALERAEAERREIIEESEAEKTKIIEDALKERERLETEARAEVTEGVAPETPAAPWFSWLWRWRIPAIKAPFRAEGGIATAPTPVIVGEEGPEAIIPLREAALGSQVYITGPLVYVEGSADEKTIEAALERVTEELETVVIEATTKGASVTTKRIRTAGLLT